MSTTFPSFLVSSFCCAAAVFNSCNAPSSATEARLSAFCTISRSCFAVWCVLIDCDDDNEETAPPVAANGDADDADDVAGAFAVVDAVVAFDLVDFENAVGDDT